MDLALWPDKQLPKTAGLQPRRAASALSWLIAVGCDTLCAHRGKRAPSTMSSDTTADTLLKRRANEPNYQHGYLRRAKRKSGAHRWEFLWRENDTAGKRIRRIAIIGTVEQYPTEELALLAA